MICASSRFNIWNASLSTVFIQLIFHMILFAIRRSFTYTLIMMTSLWFF
jgi:hypothetical protein